MENWEKKAIFGFVGYVIAGILNIKLVIAMLMSLIVVFIMVVTDNHDEDIEDISDLYNISDEMMKEYSAELLILSATFTLFTAMLFNAFI